MLAKRAHAVAAGHTVAELVVVVVILGMLAAFAIPRFVSLGVEERRTATEALAASVRSRTALAHALWIATGESPVSLGGADVAIVDGYPTTVSIQDVLTDATGFAFANGVWTRSGATTPSACTVTYTAPAELGASPDVVAVTTGC